MGQYFAEEIAAPLDLDLYIGLPSSQHSRVAPMIGPTQVQAIRALLKPAWFPYVVGLLNPRSATYRATFGGTSLSFNDEREFVRYDVEDASAGAVGNGPSLARMFAALIGRVDGRRLISPDLMNATRQPQASGRDAVLRLRTDWGLGFLPQLPSTTPPAFAVGGVRAACSSQHVLQVPKISRSWLICRKPCCSATALAQRSTAGPDTSTVRPQTRQTR